MVAGMVAGDPGQGGATWAVLQYLLGLERLGHDVLLVEPTSSLSAERTAYFAAVTKAFGLDGRAALLAAGTRETFGLGYRELRRRARGADLLLNVAGLLREHDLVARIPVRAYLDLDPAFTQLWHETGVDMRFADHTHFLTVGLALGRPECRVPTCGIPWRHTVPPVVLTQWPAERPILHDALTTVANWRSYGSIDYRGVRYGQKAHSVRAIMRLPLLTDERVLLALAVHRREGDDIDALARHGWRRIDPMWVAGDPHAYRRFVTGSKAELGIAKAGYVVSRCGWFSDRSACYLAAGRPVIAQDTGFGVRLPTGEGVLEWRTVDDAVAAIDALRSDYVLHARAARAFAVEYLDSDRVLARMLETLGATGGGGA